jgi:putative membrane protein
MKFIIRLLLGAIALWIAGSITNSVLAGMPIKGLTDPASIVLAALILGGVNALIRPLVLMFTCLLQLLTLGLFTFVVNALMLLLTSWIAGALNLAFRVENFLAALLCAVLISIVSMLLTRLVR